MTPDRKLDIERICHEALALDGVAREAFVAGACAGDEALRREVESLLRQQSREGVFLREPAMVAAAQHIAAESGSSLIGRALGAYQIQSLLGAGGMGEVYRARDTKLGRDVAIKILPRLFTSAPDRLARFEREARLLAALNHPNIGAIYGVEDVDGIPALVLELIDGLTLADRLAKGPLPLREALSVATQIAEALEAAHERGIVHRDLKPANIKLRPDGAVKVLDFGLAKAAAGDASAPDLALSSTFTIGGTHEGMILGTAAYMSPEQARGELVDKRTDIWAFGCVLYEMLTGRGAFGAASITKTLSDVLTTEPDWLRLPAETPDSVGRLLRRCLAKDRTRRLTDIHDARLDLDEASGEVPADARLARRATRRLTRLAWTMAFLLLVFVTAAAGIVMLWPRPGSNTSRRRMTFSLVLPDQVRSSGSFALSPDGRHFVFVGFSGDGPPSLWVRSIDTAATRRLPDTEDASYPFWSPQSDAIGFFAGGKLKTLAIADGVSKTLAPAPNGRGGTWSADGTILYAFVNSPLYRVSDKGGASTAATSLDTQHRQVGHRWPAFVDGRHFVYTAQGVGDGTGIYVGSLDSPASTRLVGAYSNSTVVDGRLLFVSEGALVAQSLDLDRGQVVGDTVEIAGSVALSTGLGFAAFSASSTGVLAYTAGGVDAATSELPWFDRRGKRLARLGVEAGVTQYNSYDERLSPDGRTLAINAFRSATSDIWMVDIDSGLGSRFTSDGANDLNPVWSPDGTELLFTSNRGGFYNLYRKSVAGPGEETRLLESASHQYPTDWSQHGHTILFTNVDPKTQADIWMAPATGDGKPTPVLATSFNEYAARLSPDGRWMAYTSDESGRPEVYVQRFPTATGKVRISTLGGSEPCWRADGRELFYVAANRTLTAATVTTTPDFFAGRPTKLFDTIVDTGIGSIHAIHYTPTADGQRFLISVSALSETPATVVLNWPPWTK